MSLYLHSGGWNAVYVDLVGGHNDRLDHIELRVECKFLRPLNAFLDVLATHFAQPLCLQRLELISPLDGEVLVYQMLLPAAKGIMFGDLGGFMQAVPFAPYDGFTAKHWSHRARFIDCYVPRECMRERIRSGNG